MLVVFCIILVIGGSVVTETAIAGTSARSCEVHGAGWSGSDLVGCFAKQRGLAEAVKFEDGSQGCNDGRYGTPF